MMEEGDYSKELSTNSIKNAKMGGDRHGQGVEMEGPGGTQIYSIRCTVMECSGSVVEVGGHEVVWRLQMTKV